MSGGLVSDEQGDGNCAEDKRVAFSAIVDDAGGVGTEDRAPGVEKIHIAADRAEGFAAEEVSDGCPKYRYRPIMRQP